MKDGKMTEKELAVFNYVKEAGGEVDIEEVAKALDRSPRSIGPNVNAFVANNLAERKKVKVDGDEKDHTYIVLTAEGKAFTPAAAE